MKRKYESPQSEIVELKFVHRILTNSDLEKEPEVDESGEGIPDDQVYDFNFLTRCRLNMNEAAPYRYLKSVVMSMLPHQVVSI